MEKYKLTKTLTTVYQKKHEEKQFVYVIFINKILYFTVLSIISKTENNQTCRRKILSVLCKKRENHNSKKIWTHYNTNVSIFLKLGLKLSTKT